MFKQNVQLIVLLASLATAGLALFLQGELGFALFLSALLGVLIASRRSLDSPIPTIQWGLISVSLVLAFLSVWRASPVLQLLNTLGLAITSLLAIATIYSDKIPYNITIATLLSCPFRVMGYLISLLPSFVIQAISPLFSISGHKRNNLRSVLLGLLWASPLLLIFGGLLIASDPRFQKLAEGLFTFNIDELLVIGFEFSLYWLITLIFFYLTLTPGLYLQQKNRNTDKQADFSSIPIDSVQLLTVLASINLLFFAFIGVQLTYFFGGDKLVLNTHNLSYAAYAKQGFWELVFVAMLVIPLLLIVDSLQVNKPAIVKKWALRLSILTIIATAIIELSALHRMALYLQK